MNSICSNRAWLVIGAGKSGQAAAGLLSDNDIKVILYDDNKDACVCGLSDNVLCAFGEISDSLLETVGCAVISPGISTEVEIAERCRKKGIEIIGEIELAYLFDKGKTAAITGTNGKTTTTTLLGEIMKSEYGNVIVAGNIGNPYTELVKESDENSCSVLEVSSFQLETTKSFRPRVSAVLNITPDHLNRHHTMENYIQAKLNVARAQTKEDYIVLNYEDEVLRKAAADLTPKVIFFSSKRVLEEGIFLKGDMICLRLCGKETDICKTGELNLIGEHNYENVMAAAVMAYLLGISIENIRNTVKAFESVEHRIEFVCEKNGVVYYNDSKGTNPDAAIKGICAMTRPTFLIGGGYDKGGEFDEWVRLFNGRVKKLVLIGATKERIAQTCDKYGFADYILMETFEEAVNYCMENAQAGEAVLLSPACASWGMFSNYEERGRIFKELVKK